MNRTNLFFKVEIEHDEEERIERLANEICRRLAKVYGVRQVGQDQAAQFQRIRFALLLVNDLAVDADQDRVRDRRIPVRIEGGHLVVGLVGGEDEVFGGGVLLVQKLQNALLLVGKVHAHRHHIEGPLAV